MRFRLGVAARVRAAIAAILAPSASAPGPKTVRFRADGIQRRHSIVMCKDLKGKPAPDVKATADRRVGKRSGPRSGRSLQ
jgi:hypothetical protein